MEQRDAQYKYWAFISYSHVDKAWGNWLHRRLETHSIPKRLRETRPDGVIPKRLIPVFRDREELPTSADLGNSLTDALDQSHTLVVICSPNAAQSRWVNEEVLHFKQSGRADRILCLIVAGEPNATDKESPELECFPPAIRFDVDSSGELTDTRVEPIAADARAGNDARKDCLLKLVAGILGVGFDELKQRELQRQVRRWIAVTMSSVLLAAGALALTLVAIAARNEANRQRMIADENFNEAQRQENIALHERDRAEKNFREARNAVDRFFTRVSEEELLNTEGLQPVRKRLLEDALQYYERFSKQKSDSPDVQAELAASLSRVGEITDLIGRKHEALQACQKAVSILQSLAESAPQANRIELEVVLEGNNVPPNTNPHDPASRGPSMGIAMEATKDSDSIDDSLGVPVIGMKPDGPAERAGVQSGDIIVSINGQKMKSSGEIQEYVHSQQPGSKLSVTVLRNLYRTYCRSLSKAFDALATTQWGMGEAERGLESLQRAIDISRQLAEQYPDDMLLQQEYEDGLLNLPAFQRGVGNLVDAAATYNKLWKLYQAKGQKTPEPLGWIWDPAARQEGRVLISRIVPGSAAASSGVREGDLLLKVREEEINSETLTNSLDSLPGQTIPVVISRNGKQHAIQIEVRPAPVFQAAVIAHNAGVLELHHRGHPDKAQSWFDLANQIAQRLIHTYRVYTPEQTDIINSTEYFAAGIHLELGNTHLQTLPVTEASLAEAHQSFNKAMQVLEALVEKNPAVIAYLELLSIAQVNAASVLIYRGQESAAIPIQKRAIQTLERLVKINPEVPGFRANLSKTHLNLGHAVSDNQKKLKHYQKAFDLVDELLAQDGTTDLELHRISVLRSLGVTLWDVKKREQSRARYQHSLDLVKVLAQSGGLEPNVVNQMRLEILQRLHVLDTEMGKDASAQEIEQKMFKVVSERIEQMKSLPQGNGYQRKARVDLAEDINNIAIEYPDRFGKDFVFQRLLFQKLLDLYGEDPDVESLDEVEADLVSRVYGNWGWWDILDGDYQQSVISCATALRYAPDSDWIRSNYGLALLLVGQFDDAVSSYRELLDQATDHDSTSSSIVNGIEKEYVELQKEGIAHEDMPRMIQTLRKMISEREADGTKTTK